MSHLSGHDIAKLECTNNPNAAKGTVVFISCIIVKTGDLSGWYKEYEKNSYRLS